jgi:hypothetical protein
MCLPSGRDGVARGTEMMQEYGYMSSGAWLAMALLMMLLTLAVAALTVSLVRGRQQR